MSSACCEKHGLEWIVKTTRTRCRFLQDIFNKDAHAGKVDVDDDDLEYHPELSAVSGGADGDADDGDEGAEYEGPALHTRHRAISGDKTRIAASVQLPELPATATASVVEGVFLDGVVFTDLQLRQLFCQVQVHCQQLLVTFLISTQRTVTPSHVRF